MTDRFACQLSKHSNAYLSPLVYISMPSSCNKSHLIKCLSTRSNPGLYFLLLHLGTLDLNSDFVFLKHLKDSLGSLGIVSNRYIASHPGIMVLTVSRVKTNWTGFTLDC